MNFFYQANQIVETVGTENEDNNICYTKNVENILTLSGILSMNLKKRLYLDKRGTSAWITAKQRFILKLNETNFIIRTRAALSSKKGIHPQLFLLQHLASRGSYEYAKFSLLDYKDGYLRTRFHKIYNFEKQQPLNNQTYIHRININR